MNGQATPSEPIFPLSALGVGEPAEISLVTGDAADVNRLAELGIRSGVPIQVITSGVPCVAQVAGQRLCLRGGERWEVLVRRL